MIAFFLLLHKLTKGDGRSDDLEYFGASTSSTGAGRRSQSREDLLEAEWEERKAKRDEERRRRFSVAEEYI